MNCPNHAMLPISGSAKVPVAIAIRNRISPNTFLPGNYEVFGCPFCSRAEMQATEGVTWGPIVVDVPAWKRD